MPLNLYFLVIGHLKRDRAQKRHFFEIVMKERFDIKPYAIVLFTQKLMVFL